MTYEDNHKKMTLTKLDEFKLDGLEVNESMIGECKEWIVARYADTYVVCPPYQAAYEIDDLKELKGFLQGKHSPNAREIPIHI